MGEKLKGGLITLGLVGVGTAGTLTYFHFQEQQEGASPPPSTAPAVGAAPAETSGGFPTLPEESDTPETSTTTTLAQAIGNTTSTAALAPAPAPAGEQGPSGTVYTVYYGGVANIGCYGTVQVVVQEADVAPGDEGTGKHSGLVALSRTTTNDSYRHIDESGTRAIAFYRGMLEDSANGSLEKVLALDPDGLSNTPVGTEFTGGTQCFYDDTGHPIGTGPASLA